MASQCAPTGWFTGSSLDTQHRVPLPTVTDRGPKWGQTKPRGGGITRKHVKGEGEYLWHLTRLISRTQVSRFSEPLPGDCCQGNRVRGKSGSLQDRGGGGGCCDRFGHIKWKLPAFMSLWQSEFIHKGYCESLLTSTNFPLQRHYWACCQTPQACSEQLVQRIVGFESINHWVKRSWLEREHLIWLRAARRWSFGKQLKTLQSSS